ncbi:MAG: type IV pilus twitching motility protein PilT [Candidatus Vogelbacteria bacterium]|nr:type IV pilus twitching motility protein PilT [Candidatus Vogelbacteria bacterium]
MDYAKEIADLIDIVIKQGASDLHISSLRHPTIRVSGELVPLVNKPVLSPEDSMALTLEMLHPDERELLLKQKDLDFAYSLANGTRFRGNAFFQKGHVGAALRLIPAKIPTIEELNLPPIIKDFAFKEQGFFIVVGPVGQGKSTTLASMVQLVNSSRSKHIITVEDPIEYLFTEDKSIIDQREVGVDTKDFSTALRAMFREDVNVGMIAEMRDSETMATAVTAAETGHLIFSTLHTNNAAQTIDRIIDTFPGDQQNQIRLQLSTSLLAIFSQRLIPRVSGGRIPAYELLINNYAIGNLIRESRTAEITSVLETSAEEGMVSMNQTLADLVRRGEITQETAFKYTLNPEALQRRLT